MTISKTSEGYEVSCPGNQTVPAVEGKKRFKACFDLSHCETCPFAKQCGTIEQKTNRTFYFTDADYERGVRLRNIEEIPEKRRHLRNNVEATMHEFSCKLNNHKLRVRGLNKASEYFILSAIGINFGRISRFFSFELFFAKITGFLILEKRKCYFLKII